MSRVTLQAKEVKRHGVGTDKWLIVRSAPKHLLILTDSGEKNRVDAGDKLDIEPFKAIEVENPHSKAMTVEYQFTKRDLSPSLPMQVTTTQAVAQRFITREHIRIEPDQKRRLVEAESTRSECLVQNISRIEAEAMVGDMNVSPTIGLPLLGDRKSPAGMTVSGSGELWAYNNSETPVTIALMEVHQ